MTFDLDQQLHAIRQLVLATIDQHIAELQQDVDEAVARGDERGRQVSQDFLDRSKANRASAEALVAID